MNIFQRFVAYLQLREAVRKADDAHRKDGGRYYVMPTFGTDKKPKVVVMDRYNFRKLKHKGYISTKATTRDLIGECFYFTPYRNGSGFITPEFQHRKHLQYLSWYAAELKAAKINRKRKKAKK